MPHAIKIPLLVLMMLALLAMVVDATQATGYAAETPAAFSCDTVTTIPAAECQALVDLYTNTAGSTWTRNNNWLSHPEPCRWFGVFCREGRVTQLFLTANKLTGRLPSTLIGLAYLEELYLHENALTGTLPADLGRWQQLKKLYLSNNQMDGEVPSSIGQMSNLEELSLQGSGFSGILPGEAIDLTNLKRLWVNQQLCVPVDASVEAWLATIPEVSAVNRGCVLADRTNQLINGSLEGSLYSTVQIPRGWLEMGEPYFSGTAPFTDIQPRTGKSAARLGAYQPGVPEVAPFQFDRIQQTLTIPDRDHLALSFYYQIRSDDACGSDFAYVFAKLPMQRPVQIGLFELCQATQTSGWTEAIIDLSPVRGKTADIYIDVRLNERNGSALYVDDIYLAQERNPDVVSSNSLFLPAIQNGTSAAAPYTRQCNPSGGSGGLQPGVHVTQVAGLEALVIVGHGYDPARPTFLSFYLHGDSGEYRDHEGGAVRNLVEEQGWIFVSPLRPGPDHSWATNGELNTERVSAVFDEMFARYNVCQDVLFGSGMSGGSYFWDYYFFPFKGDVYPAFFSLNCGGSGVWDGLYQGKLLARTRTYEAIKARSRFHYRIGSKDFALPFAQSGAEGHSAAGFDMIFELLEGVDHCAYDIKGTIREHWLRARDDFDLNALRS